MQCVFSLEECVSAVQHSDSVIDSSLVNQCDLRKTSFSMDFSFGVGWSSSSSWSVTAEVFFFCIYSKQIKYSKLLWNVVYSLVFSYVESFNSRLVVEKTQVLLITLIIGSVALPVSHDSMTLNQQYQDPAKWNSAILLFICVLFRLWHLKKAYG